MYGVGISIRKPSIGVICGKRKRLSPFLVNNMVRTRRQQYALSVAAGPPLQITSRLANPRVSATHPSHLSTWNFSRHSRRPTFYKSRHLPVSQHSSHCHQHGSSNRPQRMSPFTERGIEKFARIYADQFEEFRQ